MKLSHKLTLLASVPALALTTPAAAQTNQLEEVIVTAQKRSQSVQDVPIAISAFSGDTVSKMGVVNLQDMAAFVASAELFDDRGAGQPTWIIRGVGTNDFNSNNTPTAAVYYDEVYQGSNVLGGFGLFDLERIEVLKGPQGGLYGRNTTGGAVRILSVAPDMEQAGGYVRLSYGRWGRTQLEGAFGAPIGDNAAFRISAITDQGGGWQDSLATPKDDHWGDRDFLAVRAQLLFQPSDTVSINVKVDGGRDRSETTLNKSVGMWEVDGAFYGTPCPSALAGGVADCANFANHTLAVLGATDIGPLPSDQSRNGDRVTSNPINELDNEWLAETITIDWDFDSFNLKSVTNYTDYEFAQMFDFDGTALTLLHEDSKLEFKNWSQEIRLTSVSSGPFTWLLGANYTNYDLDEFRLVNLTQHLLWFPVAVERTFKQKEEQWSVYGQAAYEINEKVSVNASLRYTDESKNLVGYTGVALSDPFFLLGGPGIYFGPTNKSYDLDSNWSGHIGINFKPNDYTLLYAKMTRGFKSGGFFGGFAFSDPELNPYKEETVWSYEAGFKTEIPNAGIRLNGTLYFYDYRDVQGFTQVVDPILGVLTKLGNIGDAEHKGAELDLLWQPPTVEGLIFQASLAWLDADITNSDTIASSVLRNGIHKAIDDPTAFASLQGASRIFAPDFSYTTGVTYEWALDNGLRPSARLNYSWRDDLITAGSTSGLFGFDFSGMRHTGYGLLNGRISVASDKGWEIALIGRNLTDKVYLNRTSTDDMLNFVQNPGRPRTWAVEFRKQF